MKFYRIALFLLPIFFTANAQIPNGQWRDHFAYNRGIMLAITSNRVFCAMESGGMLSYQKTSKEVIKHSKVYGLSDVNISAIAYSQKTNILVVGYKNGNLDLILEKNEPQNLPDIKSKSELQSKRINNIVCEDDQAFLACDFGIVQLNLVKMEISDSYKFGPGGDAIKVNDLSIHQGSIVAATDLGIYKADLSNPNLSDYNSWKIQSNLPTGLAGYHIIENFNDELLAVYKDPISQEDQIIRIQIDDWSIWNGNSDTTINNISYYNDVLSVTGQTQTTLYNSSLTPIYSFEFKNGYQVLQDIDGVVYACGLNYGFIKKTSQSDLVFLSVEGPRFSETGKISTLEDQVWIASGGEFRPYKHGAIHNFYDEKWKSFSGNDFGKNIGNTYKIAIDPNDLNHIYAGTWAYGLIEMDDGITKNIWDKTNQPLFSDIPDNVGVRVEGIDYSPKKDLWFVLTEVSQPVYVIRSNGDWEHPTLTTSIFQSRNLYTDILVSSRGQIWVLSKGNGIVVMEEKDGTIYEKQFNLVNQDGRSISQGYCLTEDKEGKIWVGTTSGPIFYINVINIFEQSPVIGYHVKLNRNDGTGADYLLGDEAIRDIDIDGGDQKWFSTDKSGIFLTSADCNKTIHTFNEENSPMLSNSVVSIGIQEKTGEVFITTIEGLLSFMGQATVGGSDFGDVFAYPNPVEPAYEGDITITGLMEDTDVRITDISGNIVLETISLGGQAIWDGKNYDGKKVATGIYLVFLSNKDGSKTAMTKILFIH